MGPPPLSSKNDVLAIRAKGVIVGGSAVSWGGGGASKNCNFRVEEYPALHFCLCHWKAKTLFYHSVVVSSM